MAIDLADLVNNNDEEDCWYPLVGVKSGKVLLHADFLEAGTYDPADATGALKSLKSEDPKLAGGKMLEDDDLPDGKLRVNLIKSKRALKVDVMGTDSCVILKHGDQRLTIKIVKNSVEPLWNSEVIFDIPKINARKSSLR